MQEIDLPREVFEKIIKIRAELIKLTGVVGESAIVLENQKREVKILEEEYNKKITAHRSLEEDLRFEMNSVVEKYGEGTLDLNTGLYSIK
jgi:hypothetical protein